jgi:outer membrane protein
MLFRLLAAGTCFAGLLLPAHAQVIDQRTDEERAAGQNWNVTLGARLQAQPEYVGARDQRFAIRPVFSLSRGLGSRWYGAEDDNISLGFFNGDNWRAGVTGVLVWNRDEKDNRDLRGLGNTKFGGEAGVFAEIYPLSWLRARADVRHGIVAHQALVADFKLDAFGRSGAWSFGAGPRLTLAGDDYMDTYFGVTALQSARSGLRTYNPSGGIVSYGVGAQVGYAWTTRMQTTAFLRYDRLAGDVAKAPLVAERGSRDQLTVGVSTRWSFDTGY